MKRSILIICGSVGLTFAAACSGPQGDGLPLPPEQGGVVKSDRTSDLQPPTAESTADEMKERRSQSSTEVVDDATLVARLRDRLSASERAEGRAISVRASDGIVTLTGRVSTPVARDAAEAIVNDVAGVQQIENRIEVTRFAVASQARS